MIDTTPITREITKLISNGTTEQALLTTVAHLVPGPDTGRAVAGAAGWRQEQARAAGPAATSIDHAQAWEAFWEAERAGTEAKLPWRRRAEKIRHRSAQG